LQLDNIKSASVGVFGLGNVLMGDDALGPTVIAHLVAGFDFPPEVHVEDLGTPGLDLHPHLAGLDALILIDVVKAEGEPGELRLYGKEEILRHAPGPRGRDPASCTRAPGQSSRSRGERIPAGSPVRRKRS